MKPSASTFRRLQWASAFAAFMAVAMLTLANPAFARDGETEGGQSGGQSRSDESDNGGSSTSHDADDGKDDRDDDKSAKTTFATGGVAATGVSTGTGPSISVSADPDEAGEKKGELDQEEVRAAVLSGAIMPLAKVLPVVQTAVVGSVIDITLVEDVSGSWIYEIGVVNGDGVYKDVIIDARDSRLLAVRNR